MRMTVKTEQPLQDGGAPEYVYNDRTAWRCAVFVGKRYGSKVYPRRNAAHVRWTLPVTSSSPLKQHLSGGTLSLRWRGGMSSVRVVPTANTRILRRRFPGTCETVGQVFKFVWRLHWKINVVCMLLSPFVSLQSRFVTYLLTFPLIKNNFVHFVFFYVANFSHLFREVLDSSRYVLTHFLCHPWEKIVQNASCLLKT